MSILNVNQIQPVGGGSTITVSASDISASGSTITVNTLVGDVTGNVTGNLTGNVTSSSTSTFSSGLNVTGGVTVATGATISGSTNTITASTNGSERVRINSSGNVGIGTDNPSQKLNVSGNIMLDGSDQYCYLSNVGTFNSGIYVRGRTATSELRSHSTGIFTWEVTGNEKMRITSGGNVQVANGNLVFSTSGTGIDFSATGNGSGTTTSELLDDYEEGTWTPQVTQGVSGTPTYLNQYGWYVKIGRLVTTYFYIRFGSSGNTGSNSIFQLGNLPFPISSVYQTVYQRGMGVSNYHSIPGFTSANVSFYGGGNSNTFASLYQGQTAVATSSAVNSQFIIGGFEYTSE